MKASVIIFSLNLSLVKNDAVFSNLTFHVCVKGVVTQQLSPSSPTSHFS